MTTIHPFRRITVSLLCMCAAAAVYLFVYRPAEQDRSRQHKTLVEHQKQAERIQIHVQEVAQLEKKNLELKQRYSTLKSMLHDPPQPEEALNMILSRMNEAGITLLTYRPFSGIKRQTELDYTRFISYQKNQMRFETTFRKFLALLAKVESIPFFLRYDTIELNSGNSKTSGLLSVTMNYSILSSDSRQEGTRE